MADLLRIALIGTGRAARARVREISHSADARFVVVASQQQQNQDRAAELAAQCGADATTDWRQAIQRADVDAVIVSTRNQWHAAIVRASLEAGKHVCVEYPLALAQQEGEELLALARARQLVLHVEHIDLLSPWFQTLVSARDRIGELRTMVWQDLSARQPTPGDWTFTREAGFSLYAGASLLSRLVYLGGRVIRASAAETLDGLTEDGHFVRRVTTAHLTFANGVTALISDATGLAVAGPESGLRLVGTRGQLDAERRQRVVLDTGQGAEELAIVRATPGLFAQDLAVFCGQVRRNEADYVPDGHVARILEAAELARRSIAEGQGS